MVFFDFCFAIFMPDVAGVRFLDVTEEP